MTYHDVITYINRKRIQFPSNGKGFGCVGGIYAIFDAAYVIGLGPSTQNSIPPKVTSLLEELATMFSCLIRPRIPE